MYVRPAWRGRGLAAQLLDELENAARQLGFTSVRLDTGNRQVAALRLYEQSGYRPIDNYNANPMPASGGEDPRLSEATRGEAEPARTCSAVLSRPQPSSAVLSRRQPSSAVLVGHPVQPLARRGDALIGVVDGAPGGIAGTSRLPRPRPAASAPAVPRRAAAPDRRTVPRGGGPQPRPRLGAVPPPRARSRPRRTPGLLGPTSSRRR